MAVRHFGLLVKNTDKGGKTLGCNLFAPVRARGHRCLPQLKVGTMPCLPHRPAGFLSALAEALLLTEQSFTFRPVRSRNLRDPVLTRDIFLPAPSLRV
jgi:hypothetical protein